MSKCGYSPDCHVDLHAVFFIKKKVLKKGPFNYGQDIVMAFSPPVVGCLVKKDLQRGVTGPLRTPLATPPKVEVKEAREKNGEGCKKIKAKHYPEYYYYYCCLLFCMCLKVSK